MGERPCSDERWEDLLAPPSLHPDYRPEPFDAVWRRVARGRGLMWLAVGVYLGLCTAVVVVSLTAGRAWW